MNARRNFTDKIKLQRLTFAKHRCEGILDNGERCNADVRRKRWVCDHDIPDRMGGKPTFENARVLCEPCDKAKYPSDRKKIDKTKRVEAKHAGVTKPKAKIQGRGFEKSAPQPGKTKSGGDRLGVPPPRYMAGFVSPVTGRR